MCSTKLFINTALYSKLNVVKRYAGKQNSNVSLPIVQQHGSERSIFLQPYKRASDAQNIC